MIEVIALKPIAPSLRVAEQIKEKKSLYGCFQKEHVAEDVVLLPLKQGLFHAAMQAGVPIVPVCVSTTQGKIKLNRWNNGYVIVEMLPTPLGIKI